MQQPESNPVLSYPYHQKARESSLDTSRDIILNPYHDCYNGIAPAGRFVLPLQATPYMVPGIDGIYEHGVRFYAYPRALFPEPSGAWQSRWSQSTNYFRSSFLSATGPYNGPVRSTISTTTKTAGTLASSPCSPPLPAEIPRLTPSNIRVSPREESGTSERAILVEDESEKGLESDTSVIGKSVHLSSIKSSKQSVSPKPRNSSKKVLLSKMNGKKNKPKRPLTPYNYFFKDERKVILAEREEISPDKVHAIEKSDWHKRKGRTKPHGKISFHELGRMIGERWAALNPTRVAFYEAKARADRERYDRELKEYAVVELRDLDAQQAALEATVSDEARQRYLASNGRVR